MWANDHNVFQMAIKYINIFHFKALPNLDFCFENKPSGNPAIHPLFHAFDFVSQKDKDANRLYRWQHCRLSQSKLVKPIVACELGRLYNKVSILWTPIPAEKN
jgi:hypothetical protein